MYQLTAIAQRPSRKELVFRSLPVKAGSNRYSDGERPVSCSRNITQGFAAPADGKAMWRKTRRIKIRGRPLPGPRKDRRIHSTAVAVSRVWGEGTATGTPANTTRPAMAAAPKATMAMTKAAEYPKRLATRPAENELVPTNKS